MTKFSRLLVTASVGLVGCADQLTAPKAAAPGAPKAVKAYQHAHVWDYGAIPNDGQPDDAAFQAAVNAGETVFVPGGTYDLTNTVLLPSDTHIYGQAQSTVLRASGTHWNAVDPRFGNRTPAIFFAYDEATSQQTSNVTVAHLSFLSENSANIAFAFDTRFGSNIRFIDSWVTNLGMVTLDQATDVEILRNRAHGALKLPLKAIEIAYSQRVSVKHDTIRGYHHGILWWGGGSDPDSANFSWVRGTGNITIDSSHVTDVGGGIWGGNGEYIDVTNNTVERCADVCLDAEGSDHVRFIGNTARFAGHSVLSSYFFSRSVLFENNTVEQDGCTVGALPAPPSAPFPWQGMFVLQSAHHEPEQITTVLRNNRFTYTRRSCSPTGGAGRLYKTSSLSMTVDNNIMTNTVVDMAHNNNAHVYVTNNRFRFTFDVDTPAVRVGSNHFPWGVAAGSATVRGNTIRSSTSQGGAGISVWQWANHLNIPSYVEFNRICGFRTSILYKNDGVSNFYRIANNVYDGSVTPTGSTTPLVQTSANDKVYPWHC